MWLVVLMKDFGVVVDSNIDVFCILVVDCGMLEVIGYNMMFDGCFLFVKYIVICWVGWGIDVCVIFIEKIVIIRRVNGIFIIWWMSFCYKVIYNFCGLWINWRKGYVFLCVF